jgi:iron complex outermembrane receptor protein
MRTPLSATALALLTGLVVIRPLAAQDTTTSADSAHRDSVAVTRLPSVNVTVTRTDESLQRVPFAVGVLNKADLQRGQATLGMDEALNNLPGVVVANRYNFSLDQRITIRGFGARSNFGVRGLKVLLDGVPQTLPDGQSQLTNLEFANIDRVEVLRGASSSLHGNAAGGVLSFISEPAAAAPFAQQVRFESGSGDRNGDGFYKWQSWTSLRHGPMSGTVSISQFKADGFRVHSAAEIRQLNAAIDYLVSPSTAATLRFSAADNPKAENPGALTLLEYQANPDAAATANITRGADKDVQQQQLSFNLRHYDHAGNEYAATIYGLHRDLSNPIAAPPDGPFVANAGTFITIGRRVGGARLTGTRHLGPTANYPRLTFGADVQRMRDDRLERRSLSGAPTDSVLVAQVETITEFGPFVQAAWAPRRELLISTGARYDWSRFSVADHHVSDGEDNSGGRTMHAASGNGGASWTFADWLMSYLNVSTSFETPTTTELKNRPDGVGGFNDELNPQRAVNYEVGFRGQPSGRIRYSLAFFLNRISDALVQSLDVEGRSYFQNAGKVHNDGAEVGLTVQPIAAVTLSGAYTRAHYRFADYTSVIGTTPTVLDGNRLPGVPEHFWRFGLRSALPYGVYLDADHTISSSVAADDANTLYADAWGAGVTNFRLGWIGQVGQAQLSPFLGVNNLWNRNYIGSVSLNGAAGRVFEPAPGRVIYFGGELGYRAPR